MDNMDAETPALVPIALIALETGEPIERIAHEFGEAVQLDDIGMRAVPASVARKFFTQRAEQQARMEEQSRRLQEKVAQLGVPVPAGVPAGEGMTAWETMASQPDYVPARDELGRPSPRFLDEALAEGRRKDLADKALAEQRRRAREGGDD